MLEIMFFSTLRVKGERGMTLKSLSVTDKSGERGEEPRGGETVATSPEQKAKGEEKL